MENSILKIVYNLYIHLNKNKLRGGWFPVPYWLVVYLKKFDYNKRRYTLARLLMGTDLSIFAPNEYGCQEAVSRIDNILFSEPIMTYTKTALDYYLKSPKWKRISYLKSGATLLYATETGIKGSVGHILIYDPRYGLISNNSKTGKLDNHITVEYARKKYGVEYKMPEYIFEYIG